MVRGSVLAAAVQSALGDSDSYVLRSYAVVGPLVAIFLTILLVLALPGWVVATDGGVLERVGRAFGVLFGLLFVVALFSPLLFRYRRRSDDRPADDGGAEDGASDERSTSDPASEAGESDDRPTHDRAFGLAGYAMLASMYLALVVSVPEDLQESPTGVLAPIVEVLYGLPQITGIFVPLLGVLAVLGVEYGLDRLGRSDPNA